MSFESKQIFMVMLNKWPTVCKLLALHQQMRVNVENRVDRILITMRP